MTLPRSSARLAAIAVSAVGLSSLGCPPTATPAINVEAFSSLEGTAIWSEHVPDISFYQNWDGSFLTPLPTTPIDAVDVGVRFQGAFDVSNLYSPQTFVIGPRNGGPGIMRTLTYDSPIGLHTIREAQFYVIDPQVAYAWDVTAGDGLNWAQYNTVPPSGAVSLADALVIPYPAQNRGGVAETGYLSVYKITSADFVGPGSALDPNFTLSAGGRTFSGALTTVRVVNSGMCSAEVPYGGQSGILSLLQNNTETFVANQVCTGSSSANFFLNITSIVRPETGQATLGYYPNSVGGFMVLAGLDIKATGLASFAGAGECGMGANYYYDLGLNYGPVPGILSAKPTRIFFNADTEGGTPLCYGGCLYTTPVPATAPPVQQALEQTVPISIFAGVDNLLTHQVPYPNDPTGRTGIPCIAGTRFACSSDDECPTQGDFEQYCDTSDVAVYEAGGTNGVCKPKDPCGNGLGRNGGEWIYPDGSIGHVPPVTGRFVAEKAIQLGGAVLALSASEISQITAGVDVQDQRGVYTNFTCTNSAPANAAQNLTCKYIVRAKRLVHHPDTVEMVFFDDTQDYANPAFGAFVATFATGDLTAYTALCQRAYPTVNDRNFFTRRFLSTALPSSGTGTMDCGALQSAVAALTPPPPPPNCMADTDCQNSQVCTNGYCGYPSCAASGCPANLVCHQDATRPFQCGVPCTDDSQCGSGSNGTCVSGACLQSCASDVECQGLGAGGACKSGLCGISLTPGGNGGCGL
jgi:hypothetical protein